MSLVASDSASDTASAEVKPEDSRSTASTEPKPDQTAGAAPPSEQAAVHSEQSVPSSEDKQKVEGVTQSETGLSNICWIFIGVGIVMQFIIQIHNE